MRATCCSCARPTASTRSTTTSRAQRAKLLRDGQEHRKVLWTDDSPGPNILHGNGRRPRMPMLGGVPQVIFAGGDGWLYSFAPEGDGKGKAKLLWKFDCNPKDSKYSLNRATRNHIIGTPVIYDGLVYVGRGRRSGAWRRRRATCGASTRPSAAT